MTVSRITKKNNTTRQKSVLFVIYNNLEAFLIFIFTILLVIDVLAGISARHIHFEVVFATELGKYLFIWLCAVGISAAAKDHKHIRLTFFVERFPILPRVTWILSQILFLACAIFIFYWSLQLTIMQFSMQKSAMGFQFPIYIFTAALPVGFLLTAFRITVDIFIKLKHKDAVSPWEPTSPDY
jgi:TRAP-type C4-dicarboxylate transport system permease small subunit